MFTFKNFSFIFLILLFYLNKKVFSNECNNHGTLLECYNFSDFSQINFSNYSQTIIDHLLLWPADPILLDNKLDTRDLNYYASAKIDLFNLKGLDYKTNFFVNRTSSTNFNLTFYQSILNIYDEENILDESNCNLLVVDDQFRNFFSNLNELTVEYGGVNVETKTCSIIFKNAHIYSFNLQDLADSSYLVFIPTLSNSSLNSSIKNLNIINSNISLTTLLMNEMIFKDLKHITIELSNIQAIQTDLFKSFNNLKSLLINVRRFKDFYSLVDTKWMNYLNYDVRVDLSNQSQIYDGKKFKLSLIDWYSPIDTDSFLYENDDFCLFKDFPHDRLVYPIIKVGQQNNQTLNCSCTILFLIQYRGYYNQSDKEEMENDSVNHCFTDSNLNENILNCNFEQKIRDCNSQLETTTTKNQITSTQRPEECPGLEPYCECGKFCECIFCNQFQNLTQLTEIFNQINYTIQYESISLNSAEGVNIFLDQSFDLSNLNFSNGLRKIELNNFVGMIYDVNPLDKTNPKMYSDLELIIRYNKFDVYYNDSLLIDGLTCNLELIENQTNFVNIITYAKKTLTILPNEPNLTTKLCPIIFKNAQIETLNLAIPKSDLLSFYDFNGSKENLNVTIFNLTIAMPNLYLDSSIINPIVFSNTKKIFIELGDVYGIQSDVFKPMKNLRKFFLSIYNLDKLFENGTEWLSYLNNDVKVDLTNSTDIENNIQNEFRLIFSDVFGNFFYTDDDFCLFKNFPHDHLVFPFIYKGDTQINCSCTVLWLIKYRQYYNNTIGDEDADNDMNGDSVNHCLDENFEELSAQCNFEQRIKSCSPEQTTTNQSSTLFSTTSLSRNYSSVSLSTIYEPNETSMISTSTSTPYQCDNFGPYCRCGLSYISCNDFNYYNELIFKNYNVTGDIVYIFLKPSYLTKLILDNSLDLSGIGYSENTRIELELDNLIGIEIEANPFGSINNVSISLSIGNNSLINNFKGNKLIDRRTCNWNLVPIQNGFQNIFSNLEELELKPNFKTNYSCPMIFKNAFINNFRIDGVLYKFYDLPNIFGQYLNCTVNNLIINMRELYLDSNTLNDKIFAVTTFMSFQAYHFQGIQPDLFRDFPNLKELVIISSQYDLFIQNGTRWIDDLNINVYVSELNQTNIIEFIDNAFALVLNDLLETYLYPDEDICLYEQFPHNRLVVPIFLPSENNLTCTCTLLYLIQYRVYYDESFFRYNQMVSDVASKCVNENFNQKILECKFEEKLQNCSSPDTTTTSSTTYKTTKSTQIPLTTRLAFTSTMMTSIKNITTTRSSNSIAEIIKEKNRTINMLTIGISIVGVLAFILVITILIIGYKYFSIKSRTNNEEFNLIPSDFILTDE